MNNLNQYRLNFPNDTQEYIPIIVGGMGVDISSDKLALAAAKFGAIGNISDAMSPTVMDKNNKTDFIKSKYEKYKENRFSQDKTSVQFDLDEIYKAQYMYVSQTMNNKAGSGMVFINCMEKLTMNNPSETLKSRLWAALDEIGRASCRERVYAPV